jgi:hypothetical protein
MNEKAAKLLGENEALRRRAALHDDKIKEAIESELIALDKRLGQFKVGKVALSDSHAAQYRALLVERGKLVRQMASL